MQSVLVKSPRRSHPPASSGGGGGGGGEQPAQQAWGKTVRRHRRFNSP